MISTLPLLLMAQTAPSPNPVEIRPGLFVLPGSPGAATLALLKPLGITHVINLRHPTEGDFSLEVTFVRGSGGAYLSCPMDREPTFKELDAFRAQMSVLAPTAKALVHCATGNRAAGALFAYWALDGGMPESEALVFARQAGLRSSATETAVKAYIEVQRPRTGRSHFSRENAENRPSEPMDGGATHPKE